MKGISALIAARRGRSEEGFTLIEFTVVLLILAMLIAMSVPAYLGARTRTQERAVQANARTGFEAERGLWASTGQLSSDAASTLPGEEPALHWVADAVPSNTVKKTVVVSVGTTITTNDTIVLGVKADDGVCFYIRNAAGTIMQYGKDVGCTVATNTLLSGATQPSGGWLTNW